MSVMRCDRNGCENIICERFSHVLNMYICQECYTELVNESTVPPFLDGIKYFMTTKRKTPVQKNTLRESKINELFRTMEQHRGT